MPAAVHTSPSPPLPRLSPSEPEEEAKRPAAWPGGRELDAAAWPAGRELDAAAWPAGRELDAAARF